MGDPPWEGTGGGNALRRQAPPCLESGGVGGARGPQGGVSQRGAWAQGNREEGGSMCRAHRGMTPMGMEGHREETCAARTEVLVKRGVFPESVAAMRTGTHCSPPRPVSPLRGCLSPECTRWGGEEGMRLGGCQKPSFYTLSSVLFVSMYMIREISISVLYFLIHLLLLSIVYKPSVPSGPLRHRAVPSISYN